MKDNVPGYGYMKKAMPQVGAGRERKTQPQQKKPYNLTEICACGYLQNAGNVPQFPFRVRYRHGAVFFDAGPAYL